MKVFYSPQMVADTQSFSPSAGKPKAALESWKRRRFDIEVVAPVAATKRALYAAHRASYVDDVLALRACNGFGGRERSVADSLRYTSGAMMAAAWDVVTNGGFACAPVSGFHHAGFSHGGGFCTFNGLMVTAMDLLREGGATRVGILDCDQHYGDGTEDIIQRLGVRDQVVHHTVPGSRQRSARAFISNMTRLFRTKFAGCDVLLYQAGADAHIDDPLGGWMTTEELHERDRAVFRCAARMGLPVAWNLAGGYQRDRKGSIRPVLEVHDNTMAACLEYLQ